MSYLSDTIGKTFLMPIRESFHKDMIMEIEPLVLLLMGLLIFGYRTYVAWFIPERHQAYLEWIGRTFYNWEPKSRAIATSPFSFWFFRIVFLVFFLLIVFATIVILVKEINP
ncbi:MAG: hypothetical protein R3C14_42195 [Caldilineaceae bacterium]